MKKWSTSIKQYEKQLKAKKNIFEKEFLFDFKKIKDDNDTFLYFFVALDIYFRKCVLFEKILNNVDDVGTIMKRHIRPKVCKFRKEYKKVTPK